MRQIHPTSLHEKFVASGVYRDYTLNNLSPGAVEYWNVYEQPDGSRLIRVDQDGRELNARSLLTEVWVNPHGVIERFDLFGYGSQGVKDVLFVKATYTILENVVSITRSENGAASQHEEIALPAHYAIIPSSPDAGGFSRLLLGFAIARIAATHAQPVPTFFASHLFGEKPQQMFGELTEISANCLEQGKILVDHQAYAAKSYEIGSQPGVLFWLDSHNVTLQLGDTSSEMGGTLLTQYARRPDLKPILPKS